MSVCVCALELLKLKRSASIAHLLINDVWQCLEKTVPISVVFSMRNVGSDERWSQTRGSFLLSQCFARLFRRVRQPKLSENVPRGW